MGKGDRKSRRGKIQIGSFGVRRPRKKQKTIVSKPFKAKVQQVIAEAKHSVKPEAAVKTKVHPKEEIPVIKTEVQQEVATETKVKTKATAKPKAEPKEKAETKSKVKEKAEPKAETKTKKKKE